MIIYLCDDHLNLILRKNLRANPQQKLILLKELSSRKESHFSIPLACHFESHLMTDILKKSIEVMISNHEVFHLKVDPSQNDFKKSSFKTIQIGTLEFEDDTSLNEWIDSDIEKGFDLRHGNLFRFFIIQMPKRTTLYFNIHHAVWDGTSSTIFLSRLAKIYTDLKEGREPKLKKDSHKNSEAYIQKLEEFKSNKSLIQSEIAQFYHKDSKLDLPADFSQSAACSNRSNISHFNLPKELADRFNDFCVSQKISFYDGFTSLFALFLYRISGNSNFHLGSPVLGRYSREDMQSLGFYVRTAIIPAEIDSHDNFLKLIDSFRTKIPKARDYAKYPLEEIGFQAFLMYQDFRNRVQQFNGTSYERTHLNNGISQSKLDLWISVQSNGIVGGFQYPREYFREETIELFHEELLGLLDLVLSYPDRPIEELPVCEYQNNLIQNYFSAPRANDEKGLLESFEGHVNRSPSRIAVMDGTGIGISYEQLDQRANQFCSYLKSKNIKNGSIVGLSLRRSKDLLVAMLGIWKAGCAYLPLDHSFPKQRLDFIVEDAGADFIVVDLESADCFPKGKSILIENIPLDLEIRDHSTFNSSDLAYMIYTSGTTGNPKGVKVSFQNLNNFLQSMQETPGMCASDNLLAVTTISFDISILELFLPLKAGGSLYIADKEETKNPQRLGEIIGKNNITIMQATPVTWRLLLKYGWKGKKDLKILCGGEKLPKDIIKDLLSRSKSLWNMYGPTETTIWSTCKKVELDDELVTIGSPIASTEIRILDQNLKEKVYGAIGEIVIGGEGVSLGYHNRSELNAEKFFLFNDRRYYRTGDQGRFTSWGELLCLGRMDHQVKVRGFRIELGDIEFQLAQLENVSQAVVMVREDVPGDKKLVAYLKLKTKNISEAEIRDDLKKNLPDYMIPELFIMVDQIPLTPNGKVDIKALPSPIEERLKLEETSSKPKTKIEKAIANIWKEELKLPAVYLEDNFFMIGGNSLAAASVFQKISKQFQLNLDLAMLYEFPNLTLLSSEIEDLVKGKKRQFKNIVRMNSINSKKKIFFFHAIGGNTLNYRIFAEKLDDFEAYGVNSNGVDGYNLRSHSIETMAENYFRQILEIANEGPYYLVGGSLGGLLAYEVARIMKLRGLDVASVIMFDTAVPQKKRSRVDAKNRQEQKSFRTFGWDQLRRRFLGAVNFYYRLIDKPMPMHLRIPLLEFYNFLALKRYRPKPYHGNMFLIRIPMKKAGIYSKEFMGWEDFIRGSISVDFVDAPHDHFIESTEVADVFKKHLQTEK